MKVIDILEKCNEYMEVKIYACDYLTVLSTYDGKDSIDEKCNDLEVNTINVENDTLHIIANIWADEF